MLVLCVFNAFKECDYGVFHGFKMIGSRLYVVISHTSDCFDHNCFPVEHAVFYHDYADKY